MPNQEVKNKEDWVRFFNSFADLCELACKEIQYNGYCPKVEIGGQLVSSFGLRIALIFNMKHLIEVYLKSILRVAGCDEDIKTHELDKIFSILKVLLGPVINKKLPVMDDELKNYINQLIKDLPSGKYFNDLKNIIEYYYGLKFLKNSNQRLKDIKNTFFRYPEDKKRKNHDIDYCDFIYDDDFDVYKIEGDLRSLRNSFHFIEMALC